MKLISVRVPHPPNVAFTAARIRKDNPRIQEHLYS